MSVFKTKINELGGLYSLKKLSGKPYTSEEELKFLKSYNLSKNTIFIDFIKTLGGNAFNEDVVFPDLPHVPVADSFGQVLVENILSLNHGNFGIEEAMDFLEDELPDDCIPIGSKVNGDYWLYASNTGKVLYWHHELPKGENLFDISGNLSGFVSPMVIKKNVGNDSKITDFWIADDL